MEPTELEIRTCIRDFDRFTKDHEHFYDVTYEMYELKYQETPLILRQNLNEAFETRAEYLH